MSQLYLPNIYVGRTFAYDLWCLLIKKENTNIRKYKIEITFYEI
jgi:hypothetical protein